jgi:hypothetical protein
MTLYAGTKSLDAEIILNFIEGSVMMDYTLNKLGSCFESNTSVTVESEFKTKPITLKLIYLIWLSVLLLASPLVAFGMMIMGFLGNHKIITNPKIQYYYQTYLKFFYSNLQGTDEQSHNGKLYENKIKFTIPNNLWIEYELTGEYQNKIKSISLLRNIVNRKHFGKFHKKIQRGWNVVFEFIEPPQNGSVKIVYV